MHKQIHQESPVGKVNFLQLTDSIVNCQIHTSHYNHIQNRLFRREIPKMIGEHIISRHTQPNIYNKLQSETFPRLILNTFIDKIDIGFSSGKCNPMDLIYYYKKYNQNKTDIPFAIKQKPIWNSSEFSETIIRCYDLNPNVSVDSMTNTFKIDIAKI